MQLEEVKRQVKKHKDSRKAKILQSFFKTAPGEYAEGDIFYGIKVPALRKLALKFQGLSINSALRLLRSPVHEERFLALIILILKYRKSGRKIKEKIYKEYLKNTKYINNWDLVDVSAKHIVGDYLFKRGKKPLYSLAKSDLLWDRRIAILSTFYFIENEYFLDTLKISRILLKDEHDLIHKAVGWMLREVGKRDLAREEEFLKKHHSEMPRTMLRYAIEKFPRLKQEFYLYDKINCR